MLVNLIGLKDIILYYDNTTSDEIKKTIKLKKKVNKPTTLFSFLLL